MDHKCWTMFLCGLVTFLPEKSILLTCVARGWLVCLYLWALWVTRKRKENICSCCVRAVGGKAMFPLKSKLTDDTHNLEKFSSQKHDNCFSHWCVLSLSLSPFLTFVSSFSITTGLMYLHCCQSVRISQENPHLSNVNTRMHPHFCVSVHRLWLLTKNMSKFIYLAPFQEQNCTSFTSVSQKNQASGIKWTRSKSDEYIKRIRIRLISVDYALSIENV